MRLSELSVDRQSWLVQTQAVRGLRCSGGANLLDGLSLFENHVSLVICLASYKGDKVSVNRNQKLIKLEIYEKLICLAKYKGDC